MIPTGVYTIRARLPAFCTSSTVSWRDSVLRSVGCAVDDSRLFSTCRTDTRSRSRLTKSMSSSSPDPPRGANADKLFVDASRSTAASGSTVYEGERAVQEYLQFHFGSPGEVLPYEWGPKEALNFPRRCAELCTEAVVDMSGEGGGISKPGMKSSRPLLRAMDVGCSVGGVTFELTRMFDEVVGVDYSDNFVQAAERMRVNGRTEYSSLEQGSVLLRKEACLPEGTIPSRARFEQGDACSLDVGKLGSFDAVLASNLLCRLPRPRAFIADLPSLVKPGGVAVLISPYSWLAEYTPQEEWLGGFRQADKGESEGTMVDSFDTIRSLMEGDGAFKLEKRVPVTFLIREHARKFQWGCSDGTVWRRTA